MYQTIEAIWKNGRIAPLEPLIVEEDTPLIVTALKPATTKSDQPSERSVKSGFGLLKSERRAVPADFDPASLL